MPRYTASKTKAQNRAGWSAIFRHPAIVNPVTGKPGRRMRYGLATRDDAVADRLIAELDELLGDERWWSMSARAAAADRFNGRAVEIFYAAMDPYTTDTNRIRHELLPLPDRETGYRRILLIGTTGCPSPS